MSPTLSRLSKRTITLALLIPVILGGHARAEGPGSVLVVINDNSALSRTVGEYYARKRSIPAGNVCRIRSSDREEIDRSEYDRTIARPIGSFLRAKRLAESILYIVTTAGVPLRVAGTEGIDGEVAAVDSELALLYSDLKFGPHSTRGIVPNPYYAHQERFAHPQFPIYLVTRLAGYDFADIRGLIDRAQSAVNRGKVVIDMATGDDGDGENWLRDAAIKLPSDRTIFDQSKRVLLNQTGVIAYAAWGSNDKNRTQRYLNFQWLPGAIMTEYVSTNARTFARPPADWTLGTWKDPKTWFAGAPQTLIADYIHEGVTGAAGNVSEPFLHLCARPNQLLPAYLSGRNLAESYYAALPALSWQGVVVGDPLCRLNRP